MKTTEELESEMYELRSERAFLSAQLSFAMAGYWNNEPLSTEKMEEIRVKINQIDTKLSPLQMDYEKQFCHYYVRFSSEIPDVLGGRISGSSFYLVMRSKVNCEIDTTKQPVDWENDQLAKNLVTDLSKQLMLTYNNFRFEVIAKQNYPY